MTTKDFQDFLTKQAQVKSAEDKIDWEARKNDWIKYATEFVTDVKNHLAEFEEIETKISEVDLTEEKLGTYKAPKLLIYLPKEMIELEPIGTLLIGASGRFDMKGLAGTIKWVLVPEEAEKPTVKLMTNDSSDLHVADGKNSNLAWKVATPAPNIKYLPFTKEILLEAIMEVSYG